MSYIQRKCKRIFLISYACRELIRISKLLIIYNIQPIPPAYMDTNCRRLTEEGKEFLQGNFEECEVPRCLKICAIDEAPEPDGFTIGFFLK